MIGNRQDAADVVARKRGRYIGEGCSRKVYRIGDVVYKVGHDDDDRETRQERNNYRRLHNRTIPTPWVIPPMSFYTVDDLLVSAMPFIPGHHMSTCMSYYGERCDCSGHLGICVGMLAREVQEWANLEDIQGTNVKVVGKDLVIIDLDC